MSFLRRLFSRKSHAALDAVTFDTSRYRNHGTSGDDQTWSTAEGDAISLSYFPGRPTLPEGAASLEHLREHYAGRVCNDSVRMVEFALTQVENVPALWMLLKVLRPQQGALYIGSLTIPFADFCYVLKIQCEEHGITGIRETTLHIKSQSEGRALGDPDDPQFDEFFPDHPVSRLRREFGALAASLRIQEATRQQPPFGLPPSED